VIDPLTELGTWRTWEEQVRVVLPLFAQSPAYVHQPDYAQDELESVCEALQQCDIDVAGKQRDAEHGGRVYATRALGPVTRMWVDSAVEIMFLRRTLAQCCIDMKTLDVLDVGAGYGRLAVAMRPFVKSYTCVDPVSTSVEVCKQYTARYAADVEVFDIPTFRATVRHYDLAVNVHSWNECSLRQVENWLLALEALRVPLLFTVSHCQGEEAYRADDGRPSFKPLLLDRYWLAVEESVGLTGHPHALWIRK